MYLDEEGKKVGIKSSEIGSSAFILDANLSLSTPNRLWLSSKINRFVLFFISLILNIFILSWYTSFGSLCWTTISTECSPSSPSIGSRSSRYIIRITTSMPPKFNRCSSTTASIDRCLVKSLVWWSYWSFRTFSFNRLSTRITVSRKE